MEITANVLKDTFPKRKQGHLRKAFQEVADIFMALHLLISADRIEGAEQARMSRRY
jgi:hypothetical protein